MTGVSCLTIASHILSEMKKDENGHTCGFYSCFEKRDVSAVVLGKLPCMCAWECFQVHMHSDIKFTCTVILISLCM